MLYLLIAYLLILLFFSFYMLGNDILAPTVVTIGLMIYGTIVASVGNKAWGVAIPADVLIIYVLGTIAQFSGELIVRQKKVRLKAGNSSSNTDRASVSTIVKVPFVVVLFALLFCIYVAYRFNGFALRLAYSYGFTGASWQSLQRYIKNALMYSDAHMGMGLATLYAVFIVITYISIFLFVINLSKDGIKKSIKCYWYYLLLLVPYVYVQFIRGQRSGFLGVAAFAIYSYFLRKYGMNLKKIKIKTFIVVGTLSAVAIYAIFIIAGVNSGRLASENAMESIKVYSGSAIVDFAHYFNSGASHSELIGGCTFPGLRGTLARFIPSLITNEKYDVLPFVTFANGSRSNVYGAFASYYADFGLVGVILLPLLLGVIYRLLYNNARKKGASLWQIYLFAYISYGIVLAFIDVQQFRLLFSTNQLMHLFFAFFILRFCVNHYAKEG